MGTRYVLREVVCLCVRPHNRCFDTIGGGAGMAVRDWKDTETTKAVSAERVQRDDHAQAHAQRAPMRPELRATVERIIWRNRAGLEYLAKH